MARYVWLSDATTESAVANVTTAASATATTSRPQHGAIQQPHYWVIPMAAQQPAVMAGWSTCPNVFYTAQSGTVQFMQPPQPALQPQVSQLSSQGQFQIDSALLFHPHTCILNVRT